MASTSDSFAMGDDNIGIPEVSDPTRHFDYYNLILAHYQDARKATIEKKQDWDVLQVSRERYTNHPTFTSQLKPFSPDSLLVAVRENGYLAYIDELPKFNLFEELATETLFDFDDLSYRLSSGVAGGPFFRLNGEIVCVFYDKYSLRLPGKDFGNKRGILAITKTLKTNSALDGTSPNPRVIDPLYFCESYVYDTDKKTITFTSPYYDTVEMPCYDYYDVVGGKEDGGTVGLKITPVTGGNVWYPGLPLYYQLQTTVDGLDNPTISSLTIEGIKIQTGVNRIPCDFTEEGYITVYTNVPNRSWTIIFVPKRYEEVKEYYTLEVTFVDLKTFSKTLRFYTSVYDVRPYTPLIQVDSPDIYMEVPTIYDLYVPTSIGATVHYTLPIPKTTMHFLDQTFDLVLTKLPNATRDFSLEGLSATTLCTHYQSQPIKLPSVEQIPKDIKITLEGTSNLLTAQINQKDYLDGYTTSAIYAVPRYYLRPDQQILTDFSYVEGSTATYRFTFSGVGSLSIQSMDFYQVRDELNYFTKEDFELTLVSEVDGLFTYDATIRNKAFLNPVNKTTDKISFIFVYHCVRNDDGEQHDWIGEPMVGDMVLSYFPNRWTLSNLSVDNPLMGPAKLTFKCYDNLLKQYSDKYSSNPLLTLSDVKVDVNTNTTVTGDFEWDFVNENWILPININRYGPIDLGIHNNVTSSNTLTLQHPKPVIPITPTITQATQYVLVKGRVYIPITYTDTITKIFINDQQVGMESEFSDNRFYDGKYWITTIFDATNKNIIALGIDLIPLNTNPITINLNINRINDYDYNGWDITFPVNITVEPQANKIKPTLAISNFKYGEDCEGKLTMPDPLLEDAQVVCEIINVASGLAVDYPNFDPIQNSVTQSKNINIPNEVNTQKDFRLDFKIYEHKHALLDNKLPNDLFYVVSLPFTVG